MALDDLGFGPDLAAALPAGTRPARVARADRGFVTAIGDEGTVRLAFDPLHPLDPAPTTGDWVAHDGSGLVVATLPRRTAIVRADSFDPSRPQVLAANVELVGVCLGLGSPWNPRRAERFLTVAWSSGGVPLLLLTKADLAPDPERARAQAEDLAPGVEVLLVSVPSGRGVDAVAQRCGPGVTLALIGPSGVGKSTLVNVLAGREAMATSPVREVDGKGRHTTTTRELVPLPGGGVLLDTPGLRALVPWDAGEGLSRAFPDVEELAAGCRFGDCRHAGEPGCAVERAVGEGRLPPARLLGWRRLAEDLERVDADVEQRQRRSRRGGRRR